MFRRGRRPLLGRPRDARCQQCGRTLPRGPWDEHRRRWLTPSICTPCGEATHRRREQAIARAEEALREWLRRAAPYDPAHLERDRKQAEEYRKRNDRLDHGPDNPLVHILEFERALQGLTRIFLSLNVADESAYPEAFDACGHHHAEIRTLGEWDGPHPRHLSTTEPGVFVPPRGHHHVLLRHCFHGHGDQGWSAHDLAGSVYTRGEDIHIVWVNLGAVHGSG